MSHSLGDTREGKPWSQQCEAAVHMASTDRKQREMGADASQFTLSFIQTWIPDPTRVPNTFRVIVPHQHNLETTSKICPEVCLLGDSRSCQNDNINYYNPCLSTRVLACWQPRLMFMRPCDITAQEAARRQGGCDSLRKVAAPSTVVQLSWVFSVFSRYTPDAITESIHH